MPSTWSRLTVTVVLLVGFSGCQSWQSSTGIPGLGYSKAERQIVEQAENDPFPRPDQVGLDASP